MLSSGPWYATVSPTASAGRLKGKTLFTAVPHGRARRLQPRGLALVLASLPGRLRCAGGTSSSSRASTCSSWTGGARLKTPRHTTHDAEEARSASPALPAGLAFRDLGTTRSFGQAPPADHRDWVPVIHVQRV